MWKYFFYYSKSDRRAVLFLMVLILVLLALILFREEREPSELGVVPEKMTQGEERHTRPEVVRKQYTLSPFDPNLADSIELSALGIPRFAVSNILKYRRKGGRFTTEASFSRIYGLSEEKFLELKPYLRLQTNVPNLEKTPVTIQPVKADSVKRTVKYPLGVTVDVGVADTAELKKIPGIGSYIARSIVAYRERLGGFYALQQLNEVKHVTPEIMKWLVLETADIKKININAVSLEQLRAHPYINFYQAKVVVEHRKKRGEIKSLSQLSLYEEFTEKDLERLSPYFSFD